VENILFKVKKIFNVAEKRFKENKSSRRFLFVVCTFYAGKEKEKKEYIYGKVLW